MGSGFGQALCCQGGAVVVLYFADEHMQRRVQAAPTQHDRADRSVGHPPQDKILDVFFGGGTSRRGWGRGGATSVLASLSRARATLLRYRTQRSSRLF